MGQTRGGYATFIAIVVVAGVVVAGLARQVEGSRVQPEVTTVRKGLEHRLQAIQRLRLTATLRDYFSKRWRQGQSTAPNLPGEPQDRALTFVALTLEPPKWHAELWQAVAGGHNMWGFQNFNDELRRGSRNPANDRRLVSWCDGEQVTSLDATVARAEIQSYQGTFPEYVSAVLVPLSLMANPTIEAVLASERAGYSGAETLEEVETVRVVARGISKTKRVYWAVWVSPELGYAPVRFESHWVSIAEPVSGTCVVTRAMHFTEVAPGLWVPERAQTDTFRYYGTRTPEWLRTRVVTWSRLDLNDAVDTAVWAQAAPIGTEVWDGVRSIVFTQGAATTVEEFLTQRRPNASEPRTELLPVQE